LERADAIPAIWRRGTHLIPDQQRAAARRTAFLKMAQAGD
jgi:hypothetical protein